MGTLTMNDGPRRQRGQSLVELCVACIVLVPLAIGVMYVGQYIHLNQTTQMAAREAAWDAAVSPNVYRLDSLDTSGEQTRLQARSFADPSIAVQTDASAPNKFTDTLLTDYAGNQILTPGQLTLAVYSNESIPGAEGAVAKTLGDVTKALSAIGISPGGQFPPDPNGYITAQVNAKAARATRFKPLDQMDLTFHSQTALLADAWDADGGGESDTSDSSNDNSSTLPIPKRSVRSAITYLAPSTAIFGGDLGKGITTVFNTIGSIPILDQFFPMKGFNPGRTAPDVVPVDKLATYKSN